LLFLMLAFNRLPIQHLFVMSILEAAYCTSVVLTLFDPIVQGNIYQFTSKSLTKQSQLVPSVSCILPDFCLGFPHEGGFVLYCLLNKYTYCLH